MTLDSKTLDSAWVWLDRGVKQVRKFGESRHFWVVLYSRLQYLASPGQRDRDDDVHRSFRYHRRVLSNVTWEAVTWRCSDVQWWSHRKLHLHRGAGDWLRFVHSDRDTAWDTTGQQRAESWPGCGDCWDRIHGSEPEQPCRCTVESQ